MRITFLTPHINISGGVKAVLGYAHRLARRGHEVTVICPQPILAKVRIKGIPAIYPKRPLMNLLRVKPHWTDLAAAIRYVSSYAEKDIPDGDIVAATAWQTAAYVRYYSPEKGRKFYLIQHYEALFHSPNGEGEADKTYTYPLRKIVISTWLKEIMHEKFNAEAELLVTPVDFDVFYPMRNGYNEKKRICMLHHFYNWKGIDDGIKAFKIAKMKNPDIELVMFGAHLKKGDVDSDYYRSPWGSRLNEIYNSCDIFLCPSWREGLAMCSMEAMACKCALVTTNNGGCRDYAIHGRTALVSPPKRPEELAKNLIRLLENEELLKTIAENGYQYVRQFTWDKAVNKMEELFQTELTKNK